MNHARIDAVAAKTREIQEEIKGKGRREVIDRLIKELYEL